jgi:hypothetical protein
VNSVRSGLVEAVAVRAADLWWWVRHHPAVSAVAVVAGVAALGVPLSLQFVSAPPDPVRSDLEAVAERFEVDFTDAVAQLPGSYVRQFDGVADGGLRGTVARYSSSGSCWGFEVVIPELWLADGSGTPEVGPVGSLELSRCLARS